MYDRYENITDDKKSCRRIGQICSDTLLNLAHFIHTGKRQYKFKPEEYDQYNDVLKFYCMRNKIPAITSLDKLYFYENQPDNNDYFFYQMQIFFNLIDKRPSRRFCEKIFIMQSKLSNVKVPSFSKIASNIKEKLKYQVKTEKLIIENEIEEESDDEQDENKSLLKIIKNPTTFKERYNKDLKIEKSSIEEPQQFWNPSFLANLSHIECEILVDNIEAKPQIEEYSIQKWEEEIKKLISKGESINSSSFVASDSKIQSKLYKLFYYDEKEEKWIFNREQYDMFSKEEHINIEGSNTPVVCYIDSSENDLISLNSNLISHSYPNLNENEIFVYVLCGRTLSMLNFEIDYSDKDKSSIKPIFLLLHVPKEKENLPNIKRIIIQIYTFFSLISDLRITILNKMFFQMQMLTTLTIFNIVDKNINEIVTKQNKETNEETNNKSNSESEYEYEEEEKYSSY
ncbi:hypothetical protein M9Y10_034256 [Tritrichomonas musculus]|uniref:Uncharacterized protein n=1 Tax=Tritrichomonas musculus TaxID=1915356 RepID=A0ABR2KEH2_9EUKA